MSSSEISVRVSDEILWIGSEAYPLRNIARVQPVKVVPGRGRAFRGYLIAIVICVLLIAAGVVAEKTASHVTSTQVYKVLHDIAVGALGLAAVVAVISTIRLLIRILRRTAYALVIETAGTPRTALVTRDENQVFHLVQRITEAISNPQMPPWQEHVHVTNNYNTTVNAQGAKGVVTGQGNVFRGDIH